MNSNVPTLPLPNTPGPAAPADVANQSLTLDPTPENIDALKRTFHTGIETGASPAPAASSNDQNLNEFMLNGLRRTPSTGQTVFRSAQQGLLQLGQGIDYGLELAAGHPLTQNQAVKDISDSISKTLDAPGITLTQKSADWIANQIGYLGPTAPIGGFAGKGIELAADLGSELLPESVLALTRKSLTSVFGEGAYLPKVTEAGAKRVMTIGEAAESASAGAGGLAASMIPGNLVDNYNQDTNSINWKGMGVSALKDLGAGFGLPAAWFMGGTILKKAAGLFDKGAEESLSTGSLRSQSKLPSSTPLPGAESSLLDAEGKLSDEKAAASPTLQALNSALDDKRITPQEHQWMTDYLTNPEAIDGLSDQASEMLIKEGLPVDSVSKQVMLTLLSKDDLQNLNGAILDQVTSGALREDQQALSDYIVKNSLDKLKSKAQIADGIQGVTDILQSKLTARDAKLKELTDLTDKYYINSLGKNPVSQSKLFQILKSFDGDSTRARYTLPERVEQRFKAENTIKTGGKRLIKLQQQLEEARGATTKSKLRSQIERAKTAVADAKQNIPQLLGTKEELMAIRNKLIGKGLPENFQLTREYHRLRDLAEFMPQARTLLDRVEMEHQYNLQEAYKNVLGNVTDLMRSALAKQADPSKVVNYLKNRIESESPELKASGKGLSMKPAQNVIRETIEPAEAAQKQLAEEPASSPQEAQKAPTLKIAADEVEMSGAKNLTKDFEIANAKFEEFKGSKNVFKNLIECLAGSI